MFMRFIHFVHTVILSIFGTIDICKIQMDMVVAIHFKSCKPYSITFSGFLPVYKNQP